MSRIIWIGCDLSKVSSPIGFDRRCPKGHWADSETDANATANINGNVPVLNPKAMGRHCLQGYGVGVGPDGSMLPLSPAALWHTLIRPLLEVLAVGLCIRNLLLHTQFLLWFCREAALRRNVHPPLAHWPPDGLSLGGWHLHP